MRGKVNGHETQSSSGDASSSPPVAPQQLELPTPVCLSRIPPPGSARPGGHCCPPEPLSARTTLVPASAATPAPTHLFLLKPSCQGLCFAFAFPLVTAKRGETEGDGGRKCSVFLFVTVSVADTVCAAPPLQSGGHEPPLRCRPCISLSTHAVGAGTPSSASNTFLRRVCHGQEPVSVGARLWGTLSGTTGARPQ